MDNDVSIVNKLNSISKNITHILFSKVTPKIFCFTNDTYWRYDKTTFNIDAGYPKLISNGWKGIPDNFNCCGYIKNSSLQQLIFIKGDNYWIYDEISNRVIDSPATLGFDAPISSVFVSYYQQKEYNMFISNDNIILADTDNKTNKQTVKFKDVFPGIPIYSYGFYISNNYIGFRSDQSYQLYDVISKTKTSPVEETPNKNMDRVQQWCLHLYNEDIYDEADYNTCVENSGYIGNSLNNLNNLNNLNKSYEYSLNSNNDIMTSPLNLSQVYIKTHGDYYLTSGNAENPVTTINSMNADDSQIWNIEIIDEKQFAIKNKNGKYLEINKDETVILGANVINPLNKWKLIEYLNSYNIVNSYSGKSLRANNLGVEVFNPHENMIWDILPANNTSEQFDTKDIDDRYNTIINKLRETYGDYVKLGYAVNLEKTYQTNAINCFEQLKTLCKTKIVNTATKYYYPAPLSNEDKKDPEKVKKYNYDNAWRFLVNAQSVGEYNKLYKTALSNATKYCDSINKLIDEQKNKFIQSRININLAKLNSLYKAKTELYNEQYDNLNKFISDLTILIEESTMKLDSYRMKLEQSLSKVEDTQNDYSKITKSIDTFDRTNTENIKILTVLNDNEKNETHILHGVMGAMVIMLIGLLAFTQ